LNTAKQAVAKAEKAATDSNLGKAQKAINELPAGKDKSNLQKKAEHRENASRVSL
jgi:minor extracellular protease Epr